MNFTKLFLMMSINPFVGVII